jgi:L-lactate dehydrogenase (cytochrome)
VGNDIEVLFDGGIRTGADILRALGLGARACLVGRAYIYGLGAGGKPGVKRAIEILKNELSFAMALTGTNKISEIDRSVIVGAGEDGAPAPAPAKKKPAARKRTTKAME